MFSQMVLFLEGSATGLRAIQNHAIFRDLRWDPADAHGILVVYEYPGLQIFMPPSRKFEKLRFSNQWIFL